MTLSEAVSLLDDLRKAIRSMPNELLLTIMTEILREFVEREFKK